MAICDLLLSSFKEFEFVGSKWIARVNGTALPLTFEQQRVGQADSIFAIHKFRTVSPQTGYPFNKFAFILQQLGLDELAQAYNVREGTMSTFGWRPRIPAEHYQIREKLPPKLRHEWSVVTDNSLPGIFSSYGNYHHSHPERDPNEEEIIAENDIRDFNNASSRYDLGILVNLDGLAVRRKLLPPHE